MSISFATDSIDITRFAAGSRVKGRYVKGAPTVIPDVFVSVQPAKPNEILRLPEGQRTKEVLRIFSNPVDQLFTVRENGNISADRINWKGQDYEVAMVEDWTDKDISHFKSMAVRIDVQENEKGFN